MRRFSGVHCFLAILLMMFSTIGLNAQLNRGVIEGIVTDPQGAVVPGVAVTITSVDRNVTYPTKTNSAGYYRLVDLIPGKYTAHFEAGGFSPLDITNIELGANQVARTDAQLTLGAARQSVQVTAEVPLVERAPANFSTTLDTRTIQEIPLQGRDLQQLIFLVPGVANTAGPPGSNFGFNSEYGTFPDPTHAQGSDVAVNGGQGGANAWYIDGSLNHSNMAENIVVNPIPDTVSEFQVVANGFSAEYGRTGGGIFNVVLKSGTNDLHGNIYEFIRNDATNARNPFTSVGYGGQKIRERQLRFNNFGATLGGPVVLPHIYNGRNKTFFYTSWDVSILHLLGQQKYTVPTSRMRQGDFSEDPNTALYGIWDPYSTMGPAQDGTFARSALGTPLVPDGCTGQIVTDPTTGKTTTQNPTSSTCSFATQLPSNLWDPVAMFFVDSFPDPNFRDPLSTCPDAENVLAGGEKAKICSNFLGAIGTSQNFHNISLKIDHIWSDKSRYFFDWLFNPGLTTNYRLPWTGPTLPAGVGWGSVLPTYTTNSLYTLGNTYTFGPTTVNEFRLSFSRQVISTHPAQGGYPDSVSQLSKVQQLLAPSKIAEGPGAVAPIWYVGLPYGNYPGFGLPWANMTITSDAYTLIDNLTKIIGKHSLKTGFLYRLEHSARLINSATYLEFIGNNLTNNPVTGLGSGAAGLQQFMFGAAPSDGYAFAGFVFQPYSRNRYWGFYVQDDYHLSPRFTLNLGLRYDIWGSYKLRQHPNNRVCLDCPNPDLGLKGKLVYEGDPGFPKNSDLWPPNWNDFAPRVNFSWTPFADRKTILRGGYDIFYSNAYQMLNSDDTFGNTTGWAYRGEWFGSFNPSQCAILSGGKCPSWRLSDTTTDKGTLTTPVTASPFTFPAQRHDPFYGGGVYYLLKPAHDPMVQSWGLEIQRELPGNFGLSIGYVGTHGTHLIGDSYRGYNYVHTKDLLKYRYGIYEPVSITDYYSGQTADKLAEIWGTSVLPRYRLLEDYPFWDYISNQQDFDATLVYHGMNVRLQKRYSHGLSFIAAYTWSKKIASPNIGQLAALLYDPLHNARSGYIGGRGGSVGGGLIFGGSYQDADNKKADRAVAPDDIPQMLNLAVTYELPVGSGRHYLNRKGPLNQVIGGWLLTGNFNAQSGIPLPISGPCNAITCRPNLVGDPSFRGGRSKEQRIAQWINPAAFQPVFGADETFWASPDVNDDRWWRFGTAGTRLPGIHSPGFWNMDTALAKRFHVTENKFFEFRWEAFNALNHQNLGYPNTYFCLPPKADGSTDLVHQAGCSFGRITNIQTDPRSMEFALRFFW